MRIHIELTMPTGAQPGVPLTFLHRATYADSSRIRATAALPAGTKMYAYVGISEFPRFTSGTGEGVVVGPVTAGGEITLPAGTTRVNSTPPGAGTGVVRPAAINFGLTTSDPLIECDVRNKDDLTTYRVVVGDGGGGSTTTPSPTQTPTPTPTPTPTTSGTRTPVPTMTVTRTVDPDPVDVTQTVTTVPTIYETFADEVETPLGGVATGGGGSAGPDGRVITLIGATVLAAALTGLALRRNRRSLP